MGALRDIRIRCHYRNKPFVFIISIVFLFILGWSSRKSKTTGEELRRRQTFDSVNTQSPILTSRWNYTDEFKDIKTTPMIDGEVQTKRKVAIVIISTKRSGSSFIGDIFNHHPRIFYMYEPLFQLSSYHIRRSSNLPEVIFNELAIARINRSLHCSLRDPYADIPSISRDLCERTAILKKRNLCRNTLLSDVIEKWERSCADQDAVAVKLIRIQDIADLEPLSRSLDLRVIHLVRDPRPTERSRKKTGKNADLIRRKGKHAVDETDLCEHIERNLKYSVNPPEWLVGHYLLVRYEDVAQNPMSMTREMLQFAGYSFHEDVIQWLKASTGGESKGKYVNLYGTKRNSSAVLDSWRKDMTWSFVKQIQNVCEEPMKRLGYVLLGDEIALRNTSIKTTIHL